MRSFKQHSKVEVLGTPPQSWISYPDGLRLCKFLQLTKALQPLLQYASDRGAKSDDRPDFLESQFLPVKADTNHVLVRTKDLWINATHIVKCTGLHREREMARIRMVENVHTQTGRAGGTYVDPSVGFRLCHIYRLDELESNLRLVLEEHGYQLETPSQPEMVSNSNIACTAKLSCVSYYTEAENGSFLPPIKEPQMQAVLPDLYP